jgi:hypothetical protein
LSPGSPSSRPETRARRWRADWTRSSEASPLWIARVRGPGQRRPKTR